tara:strand:+ start:213 stop:803 length:591 start_codon:yes stop_codon:yes gene_type:complete
MTTDSSPLNRQPDKLDYASPTQFRFMINQLPKVQFFTTAANIPGLSLSSLEMQTPYKEIPIVGDRLTYESLTVSFIVDEYLENYTELHNWLVGIGFPENRQQFTDFRSNKSNTSVAGAGGNNDIGVVGKTTADKSMYSDATLTILSNKNNPLLEVRFSDMFPVSLSGLDYNQNVTDVEYLTASIEFRYKIYEIVPL